MTKFRRQVVGVCKNIMQSDKYRWLNDAVYAIAGEVRVTADIPNTQVKQEDVRLVFGVVELSGSPLPNSLIVTRLAP